MRKISKILILVLIIGGLFSLGLFRNPMGFGEGMVEGKKIAQIEIKEIIEETLIKKAEQNPNEFLRVIILFHKKPVGYRAFVESLGGKVFYDYNIIEGIAIILPGRAVERLKELKNLVSIQEDKKVHAFLTESVPLIKANDAWVLGYNGSSTKVCIVDTGIDYNHPALTGKDAGQKCYCCSHYTPQGKCTAGCCPDGGYIEDNAMDDNGHGTHCAGIVASVNETYKGVAYGANLMAAKVLDKDGSGYMSDVISGVQWCSAQGADVISLSLGGNTKYIGYCDTNADATAINSAVDAGSVVTVASGNSAWTDGVSSPACASKAITVGATDKSDNVASYSNGGPQLDVVAPGGEWGNPADTPPYFEIVSLFSPNVATDSDLCFLEWGTPTACHDEEYKVDSDFIRCVGTSQSTPHVAGVAALILAANPSLTSLEVSSIIDNTADDLGPSGFDNMYGYGRANALAAVEYALSKPDLTVTSSDIIFSKDNPSPGEIITISAIIHNNGRDYPEINKLNIGSQVNGASATTDSYQGTYIPGNANDGDYLTAWASKYNSGWVKIDLTGIKSIKKVHWDDSYFVSDNQPGDFTIKISTDDVSYTTIDSVTGYTGSSYTKILDTPVKARYVKMEMTARAAGSAATLDELEVYEVYYDTVVRFYNGDPDGSPAGTQIGSDQHLSSVPASGTTTASVEWTAVSGTHDIYVKVDPDNLIPESDETNNQAYKSILVGEGIISISIENSTLDYGILALSPSSTEPTKKSTLDLEPPKTPVIENTGTVAVDLDVKSSSAINSATWTLVTSGEIGQDKYCHQYSTTTGAAWYDFPTPVGVWASDIITNMVPSATSSLDLQILMPTGSSDPSQKTIIVTIRATQSGQ